MQVPCLYFVPSRIFYWHTYLTASYSQNVRAMRVGDFVLPLTCDQGPGQCLACRRHEYGIQWVNSGNTKKPISRMRPCVRGTQSRSGRHSLCFNPSLGQGRVLPGSAGQALPHPFSSVPIPTACLLPCLGPEASVPFFWAAL